MLGVIPKSMTHYIGQFVPNSGNMMSSKAICLQTYLPLPGCWDGSIRRRRRSCCTVMERQAVVAESNLDIIIYRLIDQGGS